MGNYYNRAFINDNEVWVTIPDVRDIPFVGRGPITKPIRITKENFEILQRLGYNIKQLTSTELIRKPLSRYYNDVQLVKNKITESDLLPNENKNLEESVDDFICTPPELLYEDEYIDDVEIVENVLVEEENVCNSEKEECDIDIEQPEQIGNAVENELPESEDNNVNQPEYDIDHMTKDQLKELLTLAGVPYKYKHTLDELRKLARENIELD